MADLYLRLSDLRAEDLSEEGIGKSFESREQKLRERAALLGWGVHRVVIENDVVSKNGRQRSASAFKRQKITLPDGTTALRVVRPGFRSILDDLATGRAQAILAEDLDRTMRDPRDLEDFIDVAEAHKINARSLSGSLTFTDGGTDGEITMARVMVTMGNKSSRDTSRRVAAARERKAVAGEFGGGTRPYGFEPDGITPRPDEYAVIKNCSRRLLQGVSLRSMALELRGAEALTVTGAPWTAETLRDVLLRPRNAALSVYRGEVIGKAPYPAAVPEDVFRAVQRKLTDPNRNTSPGAAPKYVGTGVYLCGRCDDGTSVDVTLGQRPQPRYRCRKSAHLARAQKPVDDFVLGAVAARLSLPDAVGLFAKPKSKIDVAALRFEADAIRENLTGLAEDRAMGLIDRAQMIAATEKGRARLAVLDQQMADAVVESPLFALIGAEDVRAALGALPLSVRRLVVDTVCTVTIVPATRKGSGFDPKSVRIDWK
ncbi:hypothetical protein ADK67_44165 [Saccharothrix sp. NRRL B-16348]|nr:hypothetical protein ADK67_44165 [Saccharothrix sp. NRRL B-16348]